MSALRWQGPLPDPAGDDWDYDPRRSGAPTLTCRPLFRGGYQILADGRPLKCVPTRREAVAYCAAHNAPDRAMQEDAAWAAHARAA